MLKIHVFFFLGVVFVISSCNTSLPKDVEVAYENLADHVAFNIDIKPILSDKCFQCHGPDEQKRNSDLRFDTKEGLFSKSTTGKKAFVPNRLSKSEAIARILSDDPELIMPPPESKIELTDKEKALIVKWVEDGATWNEHWSFIVPSENLKAPILNNNWTRHNPIDAFVHQKLIEYKLKPSKQATKSELLRRVTMDLTGLPPTLEDIEHFQNDDSENAYENVVNRLLETDAFAERLALEWLDVARYADSHGLHADGARNAFPWRDWVIESFKKNMPYDQFITEQLAGDLLPNPTRDQIIATAFNRNHPMTGEGGVIEEEVRLEYVANRTNTVGTALLGLTLECAKCHDHKFDPISQKEYFQMSSFFNNIKELGMTANDGDFGPLTNLTNKEQDSVLNYIDDLVLKYSNEKVKENPVLLKPIVYHGFEKVGKKNMLDGKKNATISRDVELIPGVKGKAAQFDHMYDVVKLNGGPHFDSNEPFTVSVWMNQAKDTKKTKALVGNRAEKHHRWRGWEVYLDSINRAAFKLVSVMPHDYIHISTEEPIPLNKWTHITASYDGSMNAQGMSLYVNGKEVPTTIQYNQLKGSIKHGKDRSVTVGKAQRRFTGDNGIFPGTIDELYIYAGEIIPKQAMEIYTKSSTQSQVSTVGFTNLSGNRHKIATLKKDRYTLLDSVPKVMVMQEMQPKRKTYILERGEYNKKGEEVTAGAVSKVLPFDLSRFESNRLGLSKWLFDSKNPLTARVAVNRYWQMIFGSGIVETSEDFGNQGAAPSHPQLLDWLALEFRTSGWDVKHLLKRMVMSATYRQSSEIQQKKLALDPQNKWLSRSPSYRWQAEFIRDNVLASSGLLHDKLGGESGKPYQPPGLWIEVGNFSGVLKHFKKDSNLNQYRRSMYTFIRRTAPPPFMTIFDAPNREVCTIRREQTNTPLQALVLLNDPQFVEASRALACRLGEQYGDNFETIIEKGYLLTLTRNPNKEEIKLLKNLYDQQYTYFKSKPNKVKEYLSIGDYIVPKKLDKQKIAALSVVCNTLFNMDEVSYKR